MGKITVDAATAEALKAAGPGAELVGPSGEPVGGFVPPDVLPELRRILEARRRAAIESAIAAVSIEELRAIDAAGGGIPHEEVVARLGLQ